MEYGSPCLVPLPMAGNGIHASGERHHSAEVHIADQVCGPYLPEYS